MQVALRFLVKCSLALLVSGCSRIATVEECEVVFALVNPALEKVKAIEAPHLSSSARPSGHYVPVAAEYEQLEKDLGALKVHNGRLKKAVTRYREALKQTAKGARDYERGLAEASKVRTRAGLRLVAKGNSDVKNIRRTFNSVCYPK